MGKSAVMVFSKDRVEGGGSGESFKFILQVMEPGMCILK